jgi:hypothetical protein
MDGVTSGCECLSFKILRKDEGVNEEGILGSFGTAGMQKPSPAGEGFFS